MKREISVRTNQDIYHTHAKVVASQTETEETA